MRKDIKIKILNRQALCRGCQQWVHPGEKILHSSGNREAVVFCKDCINKILEVIENENNNP